MTKFRTGAEEAKAASKGASFARTEFLTLKDGEFAYIRLLTEGERIITVNQHQMVKTKGKPVGMEGNWPEKMSAICRYDVAFSGVFPNCFICDQGLEVNPKTGKPKSPGARNWMLACVRDPVFIEVERGGKTIQVIDGYRNKKREVAVVGTDGKPTGENIWEPEVVVLNYGHKNFTSSLLGFGAHYGTLLDRDYKVTREGEGTDTIYHIVPMDPIEVDVLDEAGEPTGETEILDLREPKFMQRYGFEDEDAAFAALCEIVEERASDGYYARFFDTRVTVASDGAVSASTGPQVAAPDNDTDDDRLAALKSRVKGYSKPDTADSSNGSEPVEEPVSEPEHALADVPAPKKTPAKAGRAKAKDFD